MSSVTKELEILITGDKVEVLVNDEPIILGELYSQSCSVIGKLSKYKFTIDVEEEDE
jgi:hypothetical protein